MANDLETTRTAIKVLSDGLLDRANVVATGVGFKVSEGQRTGDLCIVCSVGEKVATAALSEKDRIPKTLDGVVTDVVQTGRIRALQAPTGRFRPAPGGVSIGHFAITAGTLGCLVRKGGQTYILSNNHVLANSNDASPGDAILQPGPIDGGDLPGDHIADLAEFVPITFRGEEPSDCAVGNAAASTLNALAIAVGSKTRLSPVRPLATTNLVDAAIARPLDDADVLDEILNIGTINGSASASLGMSVKKRGRTTGFRTGEILQVDVTSDVNYGPGQIARFTDQLMAGRMSQGGDSGSAVLDDDDNLVGLLFAGSDSTTIINRIEHVFSSLGVGL